MTTILGSVIPVVLAAEATPGQTVQAALFPLIGAIIFLGSIYLLLRANLGTRRGYYVFGSALFGFMLILSLFWAFGAPGTPIATGPTNLPGQVPNHYQDAWTPFAVDSRIADLPAYDVVKAHPEGFTEVPEEFAEEADTGVSDIQGFFTTEESGKPIGDLWPPVETRYAVSENGRPILAVTFQEVDDQLQVVEDGATYTAFGFFREGSPRVPSYVFIAGSLVLFVLHAFLLDRDEQRERRAAAATKEAAERDAEKVPAGA